MTKKDYALIAKIIHDEVEDQPRATLLYGSLAQRLAINFKIDNPNFDRTRFLKACSLEVA